MVITSKNKPQLPKRFRSTHVRYAITYVVITFFVLLFLNIYSAKASQELFYNSKELSMIEKSQMAAAEISKLDIINPSAVAQAVVQMESLKVNRLIITDQEGLALYDSAYENNLSGHMVEFKEVSDALGRNNVFSWSYRDGKMESHAATPIISYGTLIGSVYMVEYDAALGALIQELQTNTLTITFILEIAVIIFSFAFSVVFNRRLRKIMASMRIIREGDYSHQVKMGGNDELTVLGEEFNDLVNRLQTSEQKRRNFVSDASHELKTPLASIKLLTDSILQNDMDTETIREFVADIGDEADRLNRMSQKLLSLSRIESQEDSDCEIVYISPTVERVVRMLSAVAEKNRVNIRTDLADDCSILILEDDLYQIIFNLVENGIKYNCAGGYLDITICRDQDNAVLTVKDTGVGIPAESLSHIFERFYRVDKARSRKSGGSGLGLSIVRNMVERNHGKIDVTSNIGAGTIFTVTFPVFDVDDISAQDRSTNE